MLLELVLCLALIAFCAVSIVNLAINAASMMAYDPMGPVAWPIVLCSLLIVLLGVNVLKLIKKKKTGDTSKPQPDTQGTVSFKEKVVGIFKSKLFLALVILFAYALLLERIGFLWSTPFFIYAYMTLLGQKKVWVKIITALITTVVMYLLFNMVLQVPLPRGYSFFRKMTLAIELLF